MRFFPADDVPGLTTYAEELPKPWVMPPYPRAHRDRLAAMLGRTVERFDPRVRMISLRWVDRIVITEGRMRMPERALVWWRIEEGSRPKDPFHEARLLGGAFHLFDANEAGLPLLLGWLAPLKIQLLHRIHDVLEKERTFSDPAPVLDALELAAERLVSPIDLLDFAERLITTHGAGLPIADAEAEGYAVVIAARFIPPQTSAGSPFSAEHREAADHFVAALEACRASEEAPAAARAVLSRHAFVEPMHGDVPLLIEAFRSVPSTASFPGSLDIVDRIAWRVGGERGKPLPELEPAPPPVSTLEVGTIDAEAEADFVMASIRTRRDRGWTLERRREGALALRRLADTLKEARGEKLTPDLVMREALLHQTASEQMERAGDRVEAARAANDACERWLDAFRAEEALASAERAAALVKNLSEPTILAQAALGMALANRALDRIDTAAEAVETARDLFHAHGDPVGEGRAMLLLSNLHGLGGRWQDAVTTASAAIDLFRVGGDRGREALAFARRAHAHWWMSGADAETLADVEAGLALCQAPGTLRSRATVLRQRADIHRLHNRLAEASTDLQEALQIFEDIEDREGRAFVLILLASTRRGAGDSTTARAHIEEAVMLFGETKNRANEAIARIERGRLRLVAEDWDGALEDARASMQLAEEAGAKTTVANAVYLEALVADLRGDPSGALAKAEEAHRMFVEWSALFDAANALALQADALLAMGRFEDAHGVALRAQPIAEATQNTWAKGVADRVLSSAAAPKGSENAPPKRRRKKPRDP